MEMFEKTLVITKEGWKVLRVFSGKNTCKAYGIPYKEHTDEQLEKEWSKLRYRNCGASNEKCPIADNEFRYSTDGWGYRIETIKKLLDSKGLPYRDDGFVAEFSHL